MCMPCTVVKTLVCCFCVHAQGSRRWALGAARPAMGSSSSRWTAICPAASRVAATSAPPSRRAWVTRGRGMPEAAAAAGIAGSSGTRYGPRQAAKRAPRPCTVRCPTFAGCGGRAARESRPLDPVYVLGVTGPWPAMLPRLRATPPEPRLPCRPCAQLTEELVGYSKSWVATAARGKSPERTPGFQAQCATKNPWC